MGEVVEMPEEFYSDARIFMVFRLEKGTVLISCQMGFFIAQPALETYPSLSFKMLTEWCIMNGDKDLMIFFESTKVSASGSSPRVISGLQSPTIKFVLFKDSSQS